MNEQLLTIKETAEILKVHWQTVRRYIKQEKISAIKIGRKVRIRKSEIDRIIRKKDKNEQVELQLRYQIQNLSSIEKKIIGLEGEVVHSESIKDSWYLPKEYKSFKENQEDFDNAKTYGLFLRESENKYTGEKKTILKTKRLAVKQDHTTCLESDVIVHSPQKTKYLLELIDHNLYKVIKKDRKVYFCKEYKIFIDQYSDREITLEIELKGDIGSRDKLRKKASEFASKIGLSEDDRIVKSKTYNIINEQYEK